MTTVEIKDTPNDYSEVFNFGNSQLTNENEVIGDILEKDEGVKKVSTGGQMCIYKLYS